MRKLIDFLKTILLLLIIVAICYFLYQNIKAPKEEDVSTQLIMQESEVKNSEKYYYSQLNDIAKIIYNCVDTNRDNLKTGNYQIEIEDDSFKEVLKEESGGDIVIQAFHSAWVAYTYDNPDLFYIDINKMNLSIEYRKNAFITKYNIKMGCVDDKNYLKDFASNQDLDTIISVVENKRKDIISTLSGSNYNKLLQVHDWLINNVEYDQTDGINQYNLYGALINGKAVCEGYSEAFKYILDEVGIESVIVSGEATNSRGMTDSHAWNYVKLNGKWYGVDVSWDDPIVIGGGSLSFEEKHEYFLKNRTIFEQGHFPDGQISEQGMKFTFPTLSEVSYN